MKKTDVVVCITFQNIKVVYSNTFAIITNFLLCYLYYKNLFFCIFSCKKNAKKIVFVIYETKNSV